MSDIEWWEDVPDEWTEQDLADMASLLGSTCTAFSDEHLMEMTPTQMADWVGLTEDDGYDLLVSLALDKEARTRFAHLISVVSEYPEINDLEKLADAVSNSRAERGVGA